MNSGEAGELKRHHAHYDVIVMITKDIHIHVMYSALHIEQRITYNFLKHL